MSGFSLLSACGAADGDGYNGGAMKRALLHASLLLIVVASAEAQNTSDDLPVFDSFVTRAASPADFDVQGVRIHCGDETHTGWSNDNTFIAGCPSKTPDIGQRVAVYGKGSKDRTSIAAVKIVLYPPDLGQLSSAAVIDATPEPDPAGAPANSILLRADGYRILVTPQTRVHFISPLQSLQQVDSNVWIVYKGRQRADGVVLADEARFSPNTFSPADEKLRDKVDYDPAAASSVPRQSAFSADFEGVDFKRIPPWPDTAMQERVNRIGESLVPAYQKRLPEDDPSKINFRFEVVHGNWGPVPAALPDGTILVPHEAVERMQSDSQLAALIADGIACVLEKQAMRLRLTVRMLTAGETAAGVASILPFVNLVGLPATFALGSRDLAVVRTEMHQSERVSLTLLRDAGYDIQQAPVAWWILLQWKQSKRGSSTPRIAATMPEPAVYLYQTLDSLWRPASAAAPEPH